MEPFIEWLSFSGLMKRWSTDEELSIVEAIKNGLIVHEKHYRHPLSKGWGESSSHDKKREIIRIDADEFVNRYEQATITLQALTFRTVDVERYERENGAAPLSGKERTELGKLRKWQKKWDASIESAVLLGISISENGGCVHKELQDEFQRRFPNQPNTVFERIWKQIPDIFKPQGGQHRPLSKMN